MKYLITILIISSYSLIVSGQLDTRATVKTSGLTTQVFLRPDSPISAATGSPASFNIAISLPAGGIMNPASAPAYITATTPIGGLSVNTTIPVEIWNDRFVYTFVITGNVNPAVNWAGNSENIAFNLVFSSAANGKIPRLDNLLNSGPIGGGINGQSYFYLDIGGAQRSDTEGVPFYSGIMGAYGNSDLYVQSITPLPVTLVSFKADKFQDRSSHLTWATASESNSSHFLVQSSTDKKLWKNLGSVKAAGNSQLIENYEYFDNNVYNGRDSRLTVYYRLQMVDLDGQVKTSPVETVVFGNGIAPGRDFVVYPNPASDGVQVEWDANRIDQPTALEFFDIQGKLVYTQKVSENTNQEYIDFGHTTIIPGLYMLRILNGEEPLDFKQIVVGQR